MNEEKDIKKETIEEKEKPTGAQPPQEPEKRVLPEQRQILIETDGNNVKIVKAEVAGNLELISILRILLKNLEK